MAEIITLEQVGDDGVINAELISLRIEHSYKIVLCSEHAGGLVSKLYILS